MVMEKRSVFLRIMSVVMALVMCLSFVLPVFAASSKNVNITSSNSIQVVKIKNRNRLDVFFGTEENNSYCKKYRKISGNVV